jgi:alkylresorcinol/alkylpyrone synthase
MQGLLALSTVVPPHELDQHQVAERARALFGSRIKNFDRLARVFASTGIERRYSVCPIDWFEQQRGWPERTSAYLEGACALYERVVRDVLEVSGLVPGDIDTVVTISSTGIATPSLEARVLPALGFRADTQRVPIFGLGCAGGVTGLAIASRLAAAQPKSTVLVVTLELCTLSFRLDRATKAEIIATSLFGDGAAAAIVTSDPARPAIANIRAATEHLWPKSLDIMGWSADDAGLGVVLSRSLPAFIAQNYRAVFLSAMERMGIDPSDVDRVVCHPGGTKVLEAIEAALEMPAGALDHERAVMRDFGNMSSPTVFFVLERALRGGMPPSLVLAALGPGFTASYVALERTNA